MMPLRLLLADDSDVMRSAIVKLLQNDPRIEIVGQAASFADTLRLTVELHRDVVLLDLYMRDEGKYPPELIKTQISKDSRCILAVSLSSDEEIQGQRFTTQELIQLDQEDKLTNARVSEIIRTKRLAAASKVAAPESFRTKID